MHSARIREPTSATAGGWKTTVYAAPSTASTSTRKGDAIGPNVNNKSKFIKTLNLTAIEHRINEGRVEVLV